MFINRNNSFNILRKIEATFLELDTSDSTNESYNGDRKKCLISKIIQYSLAGC